MNIDRKMLLAVLIVLMLSVSSIQIFGNVERVITNTSDNYPSFITNSNGGIWNATAANLQTAINDLNNNTGWVYLPSIIDISAAIKIGNGCTLYSKSRVGGLRLTNFANCSIIENYDQVNGNHNITIRGLTLDGNGQNQDAYNINQQQEAKNGIEIYAPYNRMNKDILIDDCAILNSECSAIVLEMGERVSVLNTYIKDAGISFEGSAIPQSYASGIFILSVNDCLISGVTVDGAYACGITIETTYYYSDDDDIDAEYWNYSSDWIIENCITTNCMVGIYSENIKDGTIVNCVSHDNRKTEAYTNPAVAGGIRLVRALNTTVVGCVTNRNGAATDSSSIAIDGYNNMVTASTVSDSMGYGIYTRGKNNKVSGNTVLTSGNEGIYSTGKNNIIQGNTIKNSVDDAIRIEHSTTFPISENEYTDCSNNIIEVTTGAGGYGIYCILPWASIIGNTIHSSFETGIYLGATANDTLISDNTITDSGDECIRVVSAQNVSIIGNYLDQGTITVDDEVIELDNTNNTIVSNNRIMNGVDGIQIDNSHNTLISGNRIMGCGRSIDTQGVCAYTIATDNNVIGNVNTIDVVGTGCIATNNIGGLSTFSETNQTHIADGFAWVDTDSLNVRTSDGSWLELDGSGGAADGYAYDGKIHNSNGNSYIANEQGLQDAINNLNNQSGMVILPVCDIEISSPIYLSTGCELKGTGDGSVLRLADGANCSMIRNYDQTNGNDNIKIHNIKLEGNSLGQDEWEWHLGNPSYTIHTVNHGIHLNKCNNVEIYSVTINNTHSIGIFTVGGKNYNIHDVYITKAGWLYEQSGNGMDHWYGDGIWLYNTNDSVINNIIVDDSYANGIVIEGFRDSAPEFRTHNVTVTNCIVTDTEFGYYIEDAQNIILSNSISMNCTETEIYGQGAGIRAYKCNDIQVNGFRSTSDYYTVLFDESAVNMTLTNIISKDAKQDQLSGGAFTVKGSDTKLTDCHVYNSSGNGFYFNMTNLSMDSCSATNTGLYGIRHIGLDSLEAENPWSVISNCEVTNTGNFGIEVTFNNVTLDGNVVAGTTGNGISVNSDNLRITNNRVRDTTSQGILVNVDSENVTISGNDISNIALNGIYVYGRSNSVIDNHITETSQNAIVLASKIGICSLNYIEKAGQWSSGILLSSAENYTISDNMIVGTGANSRYPVNGINGANTDKNCLITGNNIINVQYPLYQISSENVYYNQGNMSMFPQSNMTDVGNGFAWVDADSLNVRLNNGNWLELDGSGGAADGYIADGNIHNSNGNSWAPTGANIQLAINDLNSTNGGTVWLPAGTFELTNPLNLWNRSITLEGVGIGAHDGGIPSAGPCTLIRVAWAFVDDYLIDVGNSVSITHGTVIKNMALDGRQQTDAYGAIRFLNVHHGTIENVMINDFYGAYPDYGMGINVTSTIGYGSYYNTFEHIFARRCTVGVRYGYIANANNFVSGQLTGRGTTEAYGIVIHGGDTNWIGNVDHEHYKHTGSAATYIKTMGTGTDQNKFVGTRYEYNYNSIKIDGGGGSGDNMFMFCTVANSEPGGTAIIDNGNQKSHFFGFKNDTVEFTSTGDILPQQNDTYSLGSPTMWWKDIYVSSGSLYIGGKALTNDGGTLTWDGDLNITGIVVPNTLEQDTDYGQFNYYDFDIMLMNTSTGDKNVTFPTPANMVNFKNGQIITIYNVGSTENNTFIYPNGNEVDGSTDTIAIRPNGYATFMKVGGEIRITNSHLTSIFVEVKDYPNLEFHLDFSNSSHITDSTGLTIDNVTESAHGRIGYTNLTGSPTIAANAQNGLTAAEFSSSNSPIYFGDVELHSNAAGRGMHAFVVAKPSSGYDSIISKYYDSTPDRGWDIETSRAFFYDNGAGTGSEATLSITPNYDEWQIIDISWDAGGNAIQYINGFKRQTSSAITVDIEDTTSILMVGCRDLSSNDYTGYIGEIIVYSDVLSAADRVAMAGSLGAKWGINVASMSTNVEVFWERNEGTNTLTPITDNDHVNLGLGNLSADAINLSSLITLTPRTTPTAPVAKGTIYMNVTDNKLWCWDGTAWSALAGGTAGSSDGYAYDGKIHTSLGTNYVCNEANVQAALDAVGAAGGGWVELPVCNITITTELLIDNNTWLRGQGASSILYLGDGANCSLILNKGWTNGYSYPSAPNTGIRISDMTLDGNTNNNPRYYRVTDSSQMACGIKFMVCHNTSIQNVIFKDIGNDGVNWRCSNNAIVDNCQFYRLGLNYSGYGSEVTTRGVYYFYMNDAQFTNNYVEDIWCSGVGIEPGFGSGTSPTMSGYIVTGNTIKNCWNGIWVEGWNNTGGEIRDGVISNNIIINMTREGAYGGVSNEGRMNGIAVVRYTYNWTINNNVIKRAGNLSDLDEGAGIFAHGGDKTVTGNTVSNIYGRGIEAHGDAIVSSNIISNCTDWGIYVTVPSDVDERYTFNPLISNNKLNNTVGGIRLAVSGTTYYAVNNKGGSISGNVIEDCHAKGADWSYCGIYNRFFNMTISGNSIQGGYDGICNEGSYTIISNNNIKESARNGIHQYKAGIPIERVVISNNIITDVGDGNDFYMSFYDTYNSIINGNICYGDGYGIDERDANCDYNIYMANNVDCNNQDFDINGANCIGDATTNIGTFS